MLIKRKKGWEISENLATPEDVFMNRRSWLKKMSIAGAGIATAGGLAGLASPRVAQAAAFDGLTTNQTYKLDRPLTSEENATNYCNFYEFGSHKKIASAAQALKTEPWTIKIDGEVNSPLTIDAKDLIGQMPIEERLYRLRCVEAWAMAVPWVGFPMSELVKKVEPLSSAKYIYFETATDADTMPGLKQFWYPWPYTEAITIEEAMNDMTFLAVGLYGKEMPKQNGAPIRLVLPWKYGFKSIKSLVSIKFSSERPVSFWEKLGPNEYGFWANVNPEVSHPRWSQATERVLGTSERVPTLKFNGYGEFVADLYKDIPASENLYR